MRNPFRWMILPLALGTPLVFTAAGQAPTNNGEEAAVRALIKAFADARNGKDGARVAAFYSDDGEWIGEGELLRHKGRQALTKLWTNLPGHAARTVRSVEFLSKAIALVRVQIEYDTRPGADRFHNEVFVLIEELGEWKIRVHHTVN